jgi:hypothetical protein
MKSKSFEFHFKLCPQKKGHTRNVKMVVNVNANSGTEARALAIEKLFNEGFSMNKFKIEKMIRTDDNA